MMCFHDNSPCAPMQTRLESLAPSLLAAAQPISKPFVFQSVQSRSSVQSEAILQWRSTPSSRCPDWLVEVGETLRHNACEHVTVHQGLSPSGPSCPGHRWTTLVRLDPLRPPHQSWRLRPSGRVLRLFPCPCTSCAGRTPDL